MHSFKRSLFVALLVSASFQLHCAGCGGGAPGKVPSDPSSVDPVGTAVTVRPVVSLAIRSSTEPTLGIGWPWLVEARVIHSAALGGGGAEKSFVVGGENDFTLRVVDAAGQVLNLPFVRVGASQAATVLDAQTQLQLAWRLPAADAARLAAGRYTVSLELLTGGLKVRSVPVVVTLTATPPGSPATPRLVAAEDAVARGDHAAADAELAAILAANPQHVQALSRRAELRELEGNLQAAYDGFNAAINAAVAAEKDAPEGGPRHLYFRRAALAEKLGLVNE